jgi:hypothetical protein
MVIMKLTRNSKNTKPETTRAPKHRILGINDLGTLQGYISQPRPDCSNDNYALEAESGPEATKIGVNDEVRCWLQPEASIVEVFPLSSPFPDRLFFSSKTKSS